MQDRHKYVVIVTGASSGIGLATAIAAARAGLTPIATVRNPDRSDALREAVAAANVTVDIRALDVTDGDSVLACIEGVTRDHGRLDALVNNAGSGHVGTIENETLDDVRAVMEVNFFGVVAMTRAALPHLRASSGRLITVSSVGGVIGQPFNEAYCAAKFAVEGFMESLAPVAAQVGVRVCVVEPGAVASRFIANAGVDQPGLLADAGAYTGPLKNYLDRTMGQFSTGAQPPDDVGAVIAGLLTATAPPFRTQTSEWASRFVGTKLSDLTGEATISITSSWVNPPT